MINKLGDAMRPAENLEGLDLDGGWHVDELFKRPPQGTGGYTSISYLVSNEKGEKAFLKALDCSAALQDEDPVRCLFDLTSAYEFERNLLHQCKDKRLRRVVVPLADGTARVPGCFGPGLEKVPYIIFPMASGDIRREVESWKKFDLAWALRSLHHSATGLQELHGINVAHQDIKPSNVLVFPKEGSKLTDLGSASQMGNPSQIDKRSVPGDPGYATPEQLYGWSQPPDFSNRFLVDLYRLGSLIFFFFEGCSATHVIQLKLSIKHRKEFVVSNFLNDLPYIQNAFEESLIDLRRKVQEVAFELTDEIIMIAQQLCDPDPRRRGDPVARRAAYRQQHDIQAFVSRFDRLAKIAEMKLI